MSLWIEVTDASNSNPITDALFGISTGSASAYNEGNGWYYVQIDPNMNFVVRDANNQYYSACASICRK